MKITFKEEEVNIWYPGNIIKHKINGAIYLLVCPHAPAEVGEWAAVQLSGPIRFARPMEEGNHFTQYTGTVTWHAE